MKIALFYENEYYMLRMTNKEDKADLLKVYSDEKSVPFFNSDNCGGDDFYYTTEKRMEQAIEFWHWEYDRQGFVRWTIVSKETNEAVGTIELFHREAEDYLQIVVYLDWIFGAIMKLQVRLLKFWS